MNCNEDISDRHKKAKYCSDTCGVIHRHKQTETKVCDYCKKKYEIYIHRSKFSKFCGYECLSLGRTRPLPKKPKTCERSYYDRFPNLYNST